MSKKHKQKNKNQENSQKAQKEVLAEIDVTDRYFKPKREKRSKKAKKLAQNEKVAKNPKNDRREKDKMRQKASNRPFKGSLKKKRGQDKVEQKKQAQALPEAAEWDMESLVVAEPEQEAWTELAGKEPEDFGQEEQKVEATALEITQTDLEQGSKGEVVPLEEVKQGAQGDFVGKVVAQPPKKSLARKLRELNVKWPWLKILVILLAIGGAAFGIEELVRGSLHHPTEVVQEVPTEDEIMEEEATEPSEAAKTDDAQSEEASEQGESSAQTEQVPVPQLTTPERQIDTTGRKLVALTFDDGPSGATTGRLLDLLAEKQVKATFFVVGNMVQKNSALLQREVAEGHEVGSHTMTHRNLAKASAGDIRWELDQVNALFQQYLGRSVKLVRPPYGSINDTVRSQSGAPLVLWTVDTEDWKNKNPATILERVRAGAFDGTIILMHDIYATTVDAVGPVIDELRAQGYEFLTVSELAAARGVDLQNGWSYGSFRP